jgi:hypothetical protein
LRQLIIPKEKTKRNETNKCDIAETRKTLVTHSKVKNKNKKNKKKKQLLYSFGFGGHDRNRSIDTIFIEIYGIKFELFFFFELPAAAAAAAVSPMERFCDGLHKPLRAGCIVNGRTGG